MISGKAGWGGASILAPLDLSLIFDAVNHNLNWLWLLGVGGVVLSGFFSSEAFLPPGRKDLAYNPFSVEYLRVLHSSYFYLTSNEVIG